MFYTKTFLATVQVLFATTAVVTKLNETRYGVAVTLLSHYGPTYITPSSDDGHRNIEFDDDEDESVPQNITECDFGDFQFPGGWKDGVCFGLKEECCYEKNIQVFHNFTACDESKTKRPGEWDLGYCNSNDIEKCCGSWYNFTSCDESQDLEPWPNLWKDGVCSGFVEDCCYSRDSFFYRTFTTCLDSQRKIPDAWDTDDCWEVSLYDCCGTPENISSCNATLSLEPWPGMWKDDVCFGLVQECCYENDGFTHYFFPTCFESEKKIPGVWEGDTCFALNVTLCCATPQTFTQCEVNLEQTSGMWQNGVCFGLLEECCYDQYSSVLTAYTSCSEFQNEIPGEWYNGECYAYNLVECCENPRNVTEDPQNFTACESSLQQVAGMWQHGFCYGLLEDCCYEGNTGVPELRIFTSCSESHEQMQHKWNNGACEGYFEEECCESPQYVYTCESPKKPVPSNWQNGVCFNFSDYCCSSCEQLFNGIFIAFLMGWTIIVLLL